MVKSAKKQEVTDVVTAVHGIFEIVIERAEKRVLVVWEGLLRGDEG
jgi:hypothetical protein